ncbi:MULTISPECIES: hypothetical protein [Desulfovibrio]|uniref:Uncharacterized protein n=1 Tax=Desulfovibrio desulfuricans TaxID=876 RepID=A0AA94L1A1_DESDE|nr:MULTISPECIES: hypothetical protein [Desulfovibrio]ATD81152.1 hypothetical protein CNY67_06980 [Desulfovibrio sp. G11]SFW22748.1 hypothetical protein SAMN02910291_00462 [Desulfovibrio desulfuricans]SPD36773.1 Hypothetical protein DSVG11_2739 [Desulfovibrio sp. G11]
MNRNAFRVPTTQPGSRMPQYSPQQLPTTPGADVSARLSDSAGQIIAQGADQQARQLEMLGRGMQQAAKAGYDLYHDYQATKAKEAWLTYKQEATTKRAELGRMQGKDAIDPEKGITAQMAAWRAERRQALMKDLGGPAASMFDTAAKDIDSSMDAWAIDKVNTERLNYENKTSEAHISLLQDEAMTLAANPALFGQKMDALEGELKAIAGRSGLDETWVKAKFQDIQQKTLTQTISDSIAGEQLGKANAMIKAYAPMLGGAAEGLRARAAAKGRELQARARAEAERAEADANKRALDSFLTDTAGMSSEEQLATAKSRFGDNQKMYVAALDAVAFRDGAAKNIKNKEQEIRLNAQADKIAEIATLPPQESLTKFNEFSASMPVEDRKKAYEMYDNAVKATGPDARGTDYPGAKEEVLSRMATGEEFNVWTEYGGLLSPRTLKELSDKHVRDALPGIKNDFKLRAMEFLGEEKNKDLAETALGGKSINALFAVYYDSLSQEDRRNPVAMREKTDRFFTSTLLDSGRWHMRDKSVPMGLQPRYLEKKPGWFPKKGQPEYDAITTWLKGEGIKPEGAAGKYTDEQRAQAYKIMLEAQR